MKIKVRATAHVKVVQGTCELHQYIEKGLRGKSLNVWEKLYAFHEFGDSLEGSGAVIKEDFDRSLDIRVMYVKKRVDCFMKKTTLIEEHFGQELILDYDEPIRVQVILRDGI